MEAYEAQVNVTYKGQNGDLQEPVNFEATVGDILTWVAEAVQGGDIPGIAADNTANFQDFVVDRFPAQGDLPNRLMVRPKTPFGG